jgi:hypothetical protein
VLVVFHEPVELFLARGDQPSMPIVCEQRNQLSTLVAQDLVVRVRLRRGGWEANSTMSAREFSTDQSTRTVRLGRNARLTLRTSK